MKDFQYCWNHIGIHGDGTCPDLAKAIHCRNCPTYSAAAAAILDREVDADYLAQGARHYRHAKPESDPNTASVIIFRAGAGWLALPSTAFHEVCEVRPIHSLPHRRNGTILGLINVRGALLICVSLHKLLGVEPVSTGPNPERRLVLERFLVAGRKDERLVFPVDEVHGIHRFSPAQLEDAPASVAKASTTFTRKILSWNEKTVGVLDDQLLFDALNRSLA